MLVRETLAVQKWNWGSFPKPSPHSPFEPVKMHSRVIRVSKAMAWELSTHRIPIEFTHFRYTDSCFVPMLGREAGMFFPSR